MSSEPPERKYDDTPEEGADHLPEQALTLRYWQAVTTFGSAAVQRVLSEAKWSAEYPKMIKRIASEDLRTKYDAILPAAIVYEIAGREECVDDYYTLADTPRLYASDREYTPPSGVAPGFIQIDTQIALLQYGAYCLFSASDRCVGYKRERDPYRFPGSEGIAMHITTRLLWTIDDAGAHFVAEYQPWNSARGMPSHINISERAYAGGEAWRTGHNQVTINSASREFGSGGILTTEMLAEARERYEAAIDYLRKHGLEVTAIAFGER